MISLGLLRKRIEDTGAWPYVAEALKLGVSGAELARSASDEVVYRAYVDGSITSLTLREKLHRHPFPDLEELGIYSDSSLEYHLGGGLGTAIAVSEKAQRYNKPFRNGMKILDFGCGTSRVLRYLVEFLPLAEYFGSEVYKKAIEWGRESFPEVTYAEQGSIPPVGFPDATFDVIYAYSIFTHFSEPVHKEWLKELCRLLKGGGIIILTVHGRKVLLRCKDEEDVRNSMCFYEKKFDDIFYKFQDHGYIFYKCYDDNKLGLNGLNADTFGISFMSHKYILDHWSDDFEILEHDEGAESGWQDYVVLKRY